MFAVATGFGQGIKATTVDTVDIGLPLLDNTSGQEIRVLVVALASAPAAVRLLAVAAHPSQQGGVGGVLHGDLSISFMVAILDAVIVSTSGRPSAGP